VFRKKAEPIKPRKIIRRKCKQCGKMKTDPYTYTIVPSIPLWDKIPIYSKNATKTDRIDLKGNKEVEIKYYCDQECHATYMETQPDPITTRFYKPDIIDDKKFKF